MTIQSESVLWKKVVCAVALIVLVGCAGMGGPRENIRFKAKMQPKYVQGFPGKGYELTRFVLTGQSITEWTEAFETFNTLRSSYPPNVEAAYKTQMDLRKKKCPDSKFNIVSQDPNSILYEIRTANCPPNHDEHSLTRTLYGKNNVFSLIYTNKVKELPPDKREEWIKYLSEANIVTEK